MTIPATPQEALAELQGVYYRYLKGELETSVTIGFGTNRKVMTYKEIDEKLLLAEIKRLQDSIGETPVGTVGGFRQAKVDFIHGGR